MTISKGFPTGLKLVAMIVGVVAFLAFAAPASGSPLAASPALFQVDGDASDSPNRVQNVVFLDLNGDGVQNGGDRPLAGVSVTLLDSSGATVATTTTDANGRYVVRGTEGVVPGADYIARVDLRTNTTPLPGGAFNSDLSSADVTVRAGRINATAVTLPFDLALRVTVDTSTINRTARTVTFNLTVVNQGRTVESFEIIDYFDYSSRGQWAGFVAGLNPSGSAGGRSWSWNAQNPQRPVVTVNGALETGGQVSIPIVMRWNEPFPSALDQLENWAEIVNFDDGNSSTGDAASGALIDRDSSPDTNASNDAQPARVGAATDDSVNGASGDEDDHDIAGIDVPEDAFDLALISQVSTGGNLATIVPGSRVTFTITVINQGQVAAEDVIVTNYLPTSVLRLADPAWTARVNGTADRTIPGRIGPGEQRRLTIEFVATSTASGQVNNWSEISEATPVDDRGQVVVDRRTGNELRDIDSTPDRNIANDARPSGPGAATDDSVDGVGDEDDHDVVGVRIGEFDLALTSTIAGTDGDTGFAPIGNAVVFNLRIENQGSVPATDVVLIDYLPRSGLTLVDPDWRDNGDGTATLRRPVTGPIQPGASVVVPITFIANSEAAGTIYNWAEIQSADSDGDTSTLAPRDRDSNPSNNPRYDITPASQVDFDALQAAATARSESEADGQDAVEDAGTNSIPPIPNAPREATEDDHDYAGVTIDPPIFDLAVQMVLADDTDVDSLSAEEGVFFEITIFNQGTVFAREVEIVNYLPAAGLEFSSQSWTDQGDGTATIFLDEPIAPDSFRTIEVRFEVAAGVIGVVENTVEIANAVAVDFFGEEITDENNERLTDDDSVPLNALDGNDEDDTSTAAINFPAPPEYDLTLFADLADGSNRSIFQPGDSVTYAITVLNNGVVAADDIELAAQIPEGFSVVERDWEIRGDVAVGLLDQRLEPGESVTLDLEFRADATASGNVDNVVRIVRSVSVDNVGAEILATDGHTLRDVNPGDDSVTVELNVIPTLAFNGVEIDRQVLLGWGLLVALAFAALMAVTVRRKESHGVRVGLVGPATSRFGPTP